MHSFRKALFLALTGPVLALSSGCDSMGGKTEAAAAAEADKARIAEDTRREKARNDETAEREKATAAEAERQAKARSDETGKREAADAKATSATIHDYPWTRRSELVTQMNAELATIEHDLDTLKTRADRAKGDVKAQAKNKLRETHEQWIQARNDLDQLQRATEASWVDGKASCRKSYDSLKMSYESTRSWFAGKLAT